MPTTHKMMLTLLKNLRDSLLSSVSRKTCKRHRGMRARRTSSKCARELCTTWPPISDLLVRENDRTERIAQKQTQVPQVTQHPFSFLKAVIYAYDSEFQYYCKIDRISPRQRSLLVLANIPSDALSLAVCHGPSGLGRYPASSLLLCITINTTGWPPPLTESTIPSQTTYDSLLNMKKTQLCSECCHRPMKALSAHYIIKTPLRY